MLRARRIVVASVYDDASLDDHFDAATPVKEDAARPKKRQKKIFAACVHEAASYRHYFCLMPRRHAETMPLQTRQRRHAASPTVVID